MNVHILTYIQAKLHIYRQGYSGKDDPRSNMAYLPIFSRTIYFGTTTRLLHSLGI